MIQSSNDPILEVGRWPNPQVFLLLAAINNQSLIHLRHWTSGSRRFWVKVNQSNQVFQRQCSDHSESASQPNAFRSYRMLGIGAIGFWLLWTLTPVEMRNTGIPVILLWTLFGGWSAIRLIRRLARECKVNGAVLQGVLTSAPGQPACITLCKV